MTPLPLVTGRRAFCLVGLPPTWPGRAPRRTNARFHLAGWQGSALPGFHCAEAPICASRRRRPTARPSAADRTHTFAAALERCRSSQAELGAPTRRNARFHLAGWQGSALPGFHRAEARICASRRRRPTARPSAADRTHTFAAALERCRSGQAELGVPVRRNARFHLAGWQGSALPGFQCAEARICASRRRRPTARPSAADRTHTFAAALERCRSGQAELGVPTRRNARFHLAGWQGSALPEFHYAEARICASRRRRPTAWPSAADRTHTFTAALERCRSGQAELGVPTRRNARFHLAGWQGSALPGFHCAEARICGSRRRRPTARPSVADRTHTFAAALERCRSSQAELGVPVQEGNRDDDARGGSSMARLAFAIDIDCGTSVRSTMARPPTTGGVSRRAG